MLDLRPPGLESCVWRTVSSHSSHHSQEVLLAQFSLYVHKGGLKPDSFHFLCGPYVIHQRQVLNEFGQHRRWCLKEYTFELGSLVLSSIISWKFRLLTHEEDQYTDFLLIALKQTKAGSRSSGFLVIIN